MYKEIEQINREFKTEFERKGGLELLTKYVMSETISPIEDYENVVNIIRRNYCSQISNELLLIGAYLAIRWTYSNNELLDILNLMLPYLPNNKSAIVHYLNAYQLYIRDKDYLAKSEYKDELYKTLTFDVPFVYNRCKIAEFSTNGESIKYYNEAIENVQEIISEEKIMKLPLDYFLQPQSFINEFILGTCITTERYNQIKEKTNYHRF